MEAREDEGKVLQFFVHWKTPKMSTAAAPAAGHKAAPAAARHVVSSATTSGPLQFSMNYCMDTLPVKDNENKSFCLETSRRQEIRKNTKKETAFHRICEHFYFLKGKQH